MRIALDPQMLRTTPLLELPDVVAGMGYEWIELSPREDFVPFFKHPRVDTATVRALRSKLADAGVGVTSLLPVMRWSGPGEVERQAAVRYWKRAIEIAVELGVHTMNSEFNGRPEAPELAEAMFWRSMEELLPVLEREGVKLALEPHPDDFIELGHPAVDMVRGIDSPCVSFLYCLPHTFHQGDDAAGIIAHAGELLTHVHVADSMDHRASDGLRYITNPPGNSTRVHQHAEIGRGDVDFDEAFAALAGIGFDGVLTTCVFGWDDQARESGIRMLDGIRRLVAKHFPAGSLPDADAARPEGGTNRPNFPQTPLPDDTAP
ncbi:myo-inositol catabolism protein IolH [Geodermatophilus obscurus]|uniref:Myo-inositol catabolism protein IolH n=1 Tax=Geodermatophilus obscurus TaxID=1861 RepID=A0A1M7UJQ8_9ACTN|nr:sugar phosphate isomerase/epimerase [Geodermatophilus obscurus]SHN83263.1 myo-inositol catabolism protein IolH [Geodermatophilus obscurus]